ncbi:MAG: cytochrome c3 family protein [Xanthomonadales bacterium]|nr:cytochrome c3 family protein [Xanthomonadales bacterium]
MGEGGQRRWKHLSAGQRSAYRWGLVVGLVGGALLLFPGLEEWHSAGPANVGHEAMECNACHKRAEGGMSLARLEFYYAPVGNAPCLECHENPNDRHPIAHFVDAEFDAARRALGADECTGCHAQHRAARATVALTACRHCHGATIVEDDPVDVAHSVLIEEDRWETCLGCHDFHGNHAAWEVPERMSEALAPEVIQAYLDGGESPYGYRTLTVMDTMKMESEP